MNSDATQPPAQPTGIQGLWVWQEQWVADEAEQDRLIEFCRQYGFNMLMVQIHLDGGGGPSPALKYPDQLAELIRKAAEHGIAVEALEGGPEQALKENHDHTLAILDAIIAFDSTLPEDARLTGVHYDIEPYVLPAWQDLDDRRQIMLGLAQFFAKARERIDEHAPHLTLAADIPFWYDNLGEDGEVEFAGQTKNIHQHIQDICDYIGIMSYRRDATGPNSVAEHVETEMAYAEQIGKWVLPALETVELTDTPQITFFGESPESFWQTHNAVREHFADRPGFGGMLTHSYRSLRELLEGDQD
ncbi:hypothetical protein ACERK3_19350 [Phycisphaerales bacterium AB-hyl4]|uniref:Uncharacterized protein n=1 Tax=Natronomicrosphaera hydrolytica TaxID=3242702 RepID=A0ABV4UB68_9BACT